MAARNVGRNGLLADRAYWSKVHHGALRERHIQPKIAPRRVLTAPGLGRERSVVERSISWLHQHRRLRVRWGRRDDTHEAFLVIVCCLICFKHLPSSQW